MKVLVVKAKRKIMKEMPTSPREANVHPVFFQSVGATPKLGRNKPCYCKSGLKYKDCCLNKSK